MALKILEGKSLLLILALNICSFYCIGQTINQSNPNIIIFIADDVSAEDLGVYGNQVVQTPNIDMLANNGIVFKNAILTTSSCSPSRISILTGRYPHNTGAAELHTQPEIAFESIASKLKTNGYYTGQAGKWHMGKLLKEGFDQIYAKRQDIGEGGEAKWIPSLRERNMDKPFFFWFASIDAHRDWDVNEFTGSHNPEDIEVPPTLVDNDSTRLDLSRYYDEIKRLDFSIGQVIDELKRQKVYENTVILVMSDNGRPFPGDKTRIYDSGIKTPLIIHWPGYINKSLVSKSLISSIDIAPTILDICGMESPETFQGKSFRTLLNHPERNFRNYAFAEHNWHDYEAHERMVRTKDYLYIRNFRQKLPNQGPLDVVNSPSFHALVNAKETGRLTKTQSDIFIFPRPEEELFLLKDDVHQTINLIDSIPDNEKQLKLQNELIRSKLNRILMEWMEQTGDNVPEQLTKDWYTRDTGEKINKNAGKRGEMPGEGENAAHLNIKGPF